MNEGLKDASAYVTRDDLVTSVDHEAMLADLTGTEKDEWESSEGPDSGCGNDFYYYHERRSLDARINDDQGMLSIVVTDEDGDEVEEASIDVSET